MIQVFDKKGNLKTKVSALDVVEVPGGTLTFYIAGIPWWRVTVTITDFLIQFTPDGGTTWVTKQDVGI